MGEHGGVGVGIWEKRLVGLLKTPPSHTHTQHCCVQESKERPYFVMERNRQDHTL